MRLHRDYYAGIVSLDVFDETEKNLCAVHRTIIFSVQSEFSIGYDYSGKRNDETFAKCFKIHDVLTAIATINGGDYTGIDNYFNVPK